MWLGGAGGGERGAGGEWRAEELNRNCGGDLLRQRYRVSCVTGASNCYLLTVGQGLISLQQVWAEGKCFYFFCFFAFIHFPLSPLSLSFISSTISSISVLPFSGRRHELTHKG